MGSIAAHGCRKLTVAARRSASNTHGAAGLRRRCGGTMTGRQRIVSIILGAAGAIVSVLALAGFLLKMMRNGLDVPDSPSTKAYYDSIGASYADGFVAGFALCFSLTLVAVAVGTWAESRRKPSGSAPVRKPAAGVS